MQVLVATPFELIGTRSCDREAAGWWPTSGSLLPLPVSGFPACRSRFVRVDKTLLVTYDRTVYSVPPTYAGKSLLLRAFWDRIEISDRERTVATHERRAPEAAPRSLSTTCRFWPTSPAP